MRISELKKGDNCRMKNVGAIKVIGVANRYIRVKSDSMTMKIQFACNSAPLSHLGIEVLNKEVQ